LACSAAPTPGSHVPSPGDDLPGLENDSFAPCVTFPSSNILA
jgi:hypothetical protein